MFSHYIEPEVTVPCPKGSWLISKHLLNRKLSGLSFMLSAGNDKKENIFSLMLKSVTQLFICLLLMMLFILFDKLYIAKKQRSSSKYFSSIGDRLQCRATWIEHRAERDSFLWHPTTVSKAGKWAIPFIFDATIFHLISGNSSTQTRDNSSYNSSETCSQKQTSDIFQRKVPYLL